MIENLKKNLLNCSFFTLPQSSLQDFKACTTFLFNKIKCSTHISSPSMYSAYFFNQVIEGKKHQVQVVPPRHWHASARASPDLTAKLSSSYVSSTTTCALSVIMWALLVVAVLRGVQTSRLMIMKCFEMAHHKPDSNIHYIDGSILINS